MTNNLSQTTENALELLRLLYHVEITVINSSQDYVSFAAKHRFHPIQHYFSERMLEQLQDRLKGSQVFILTDAFKVRVAMFLLNGVPVLFGPFISVLLTQRDVKALVTRFRIADLAEKSLLHYTNAFPFLSEKDAIHIVSSLLLLIYPDEPAREIVNIDYQEEAEFGSEEQMLAKRENGTRLLEQRYAYEQSFIQNVSAGNARKAIRDLHRMQMDVSYLKRIGTTMENERVGAAILRTTARMAAIQACLPSVIIDKITADNALRVIKASSVDEILKAKEQMVRDLCKAVHSYREEKLSALVQSAIYCIETEYTQDITVQSLADELDVSINHLINVFKKEMQVTPNVYLRRYRLKQAARILASTDRPVQDIAAAVGIPDANYMIKLFKTEYGETPTAYRKKYRV